MKIWKEKDIMKTPREKYLNDNYYRTMVDMMVSYIDKCQFTPSELREMAILASIIYKEYQTKVRLPSKKPIKELNSAFRIFDKWAKQSARL